MIERGTSPIELKKGTFEETELIPFKSKEMTKYKIETSKEISIEKKYRVVVSKQNGLEFQGEINLNQREYLNLKEEK